MSEDLHRWLLCVWKCAIRGKNMKFCSVFLTHIRIRKRETRGRDKDRKRGTTSEGREENFSP